jgi:hypothetical protein
MVDATGAAFSSENAALLRAPSHNRCKFSYTMRTG